MASNEEQYTFTPDDLDRFMEVAVKLVHEAGEMIKASLGKTKAVNLKDETCIEGNASSVLTETDTAVENHLVSGLTAAFPDHCFIGEENISSSPTGMVEQFSNKPTWIIDPIDGTMNFIHANPLVCTSMGLAINRKVVLGIVNCPVTQELFTVIKGKGTFRNGQGPLRTSGVKQVKEAMVLVELPAGAGQEKRSVALNNVDLLMQSAHSIRCPGPAALDIAWIGAGCADAFVHHTLHCWDMVAGALMVIEAGGAVLNADGSEFDMMGRSIVCAASLDLAKELSAKLSVFKAKERDFKECCPM